MAGMAAMLAKSAGRLEFWIAFVVAVSLTGWSFAIALQTYSGTANIADFGHLAEPNSWRSSRSKIVYLFTPVFLQFIGLLYLAIPFLLGRLGHNISVRFPFRKIPLIVVASLHHVFSLRYPHP